MPAPADESTAPVETAEELFERFLGLHDEPRGPAFEALCAQHLEQATALRRLAEDWDRLADVFQALAPDGPDPGGDGDDPSTRRPRLPPTVDLPATEPADGTTDEHGTPSVQSVLERLSGEGSGARRYHVRREIDHGGMGRILRVWDGSLRRPLAMKVMLKRARRSPDGLASADERQLSRFLDEAQITGQLDHPGIVPVHELGMDAAGHLYFTMRLVRGRALSAIFELVRDGREGWTLTRALNVLLKVCEALDYAHSKRVVHRDVKPANVMVGRFGETYVMDWGLAKVLGREDSHDLRLDGPADDARHDDSLAEVRTDRGDLGSGGPDSPLVTRDGTVVGTPAFMAPEQAEGRTDDVGPHSDVYAVGAMLYQLLTGQMPYVPRGQRASPHQVLAAVRSGPPAPVGLLAPDVPPDLVAICDRAMARDVAARYPDMAHMRDELRAFLEGRVVATYEAGAMAELRKWCGRNRLLAAVILIALLGLTGALGAALVERQLAVDAADAARLAELAATENAAVARAAQLEAEAERARARSAQAAAESARDQAERSEARANDAAEQVRLASYLAFVGAAEGHLRHRELDAAATLLADCAAELRGWEWAHLGQRIDDALAVLRGHRAAVNDVAFAPGGPLIVTCSDDGTARVWDGESSTLVSTFAVGGGHVDAVAVHPDGQSAALAVSRVGGASEILRFGLRDGLELPGLVLDPDDGGVGERVLDLGFSPDGAELFAGTTTHRIVSWLLRSPRPRAFPRLHTGPVTSLALSPDGRRLVSGSSDRRAIVWEIDSRRPLLDLGPHDGAVLAVAWSPAGDRVATASEDGSLRLFDPDAASGPAAGRPLIRLRGHEGPVRDVVFDGTGVEVVSASDDRTLRVWHAYTGRPLAELPGHGGAVTACDRDDGRALLASASEDGSLRLWDPDRHGARTRLQGHVEQLRHVAVDPSGRMLASSSVDGEVRLWDGTTLLPAGPAPERGTLPAALAFTRDGGTLVVASSSEGADGATGHTILVHDVVDGAAAASPRLRLSGHDRLVDALATDAAGSLLASGDAGGGLRVWSLADGGLVSRPDERRGWILSLDFHPSRSWLAVGASDYRVLVHDVEGGRVVWDLDDLTAPARAVRWSPDGARLAVAEGRVVRLVAPDDPSAGLTLRGHQDDVLALAFHPTAPRLATASADGSIRIWDTARGMTLLTLRADTPSVDMAWSADGESLVTLDGEELLTYESAPGLDRWRLRRSRRAALQAGREVFLRRLEELVDPRDVARALQDDVVLAHEVRIEALRLADRFGTDPDRLWEEAFTVVVDGQASPDERHRALLQARAADRIRPGVARIESVLGMALYRNGRFDEALPVLARAYAKNSAQPTYPVSWNLLALAMAHEAAGDHATARSWLDRALAKRRLPGMSDDEVGRSLEAEARRLVP